MCHAIPNMTCHHQEGLMSMMFCTCGPKFHLIGHFEYASKSNRIAEIFHVFTYDFMIFRFIKNLWQGSIWCKQVSTKDIFKSRLLEVLLLNAEGKNTFCHKTSKT